MFGQYDLDKHVDTKVLHIRELEYNNFRLLTLPLFVFITYLKIL